MYATEFSFTIFGKIPQAGAFDHVCLRCHWCWNGKAQTGRHKKGEKPKSCPKCRSKLWDTPRKYQMSKSGRAAMGRRRKGEDYLDRADRLRAQGERTGAE